MEHPDFMTTDSAVLTYSAVFDVLPLPAMLLDAHGTIRDINRAFTYEAHRRGFPRAKSYWCGQSALGLSLDVPSPGWAAFITTVLETGTPQCWMETGTKSTVLTLDAHAEPIRDDGGTLSSVLILWQHRRVESVSPPVDDVFRVLIEQSSQGIALLQNQRIVFANPAMAGLLGYAVDDLLGFSLEHLSLFVHPEDEEDLLNCLRDCRVDAQIPPRFEFRVIRKDGEIRWIEIVPNLAEYRSQPAVQISGLDITERKRLERQVFQVQKMETVGRLAGGVAHDFNNLLTVILGYADMLLIRKEQDTILQDIEEIRNAARRAAALTNQLLAFSRRQLTQPRVLDLNSLLIDLEKMLNRLIGEHIRLTIVPEPMLGFVKMDPGQVEQVVMNLAVNARDAMQHGGVLTIRTANATLEASVAPHIEIQPGPYIRLTVSDTGCGMDEETQARMFEPFFTTKAHGEGTGLGLSTVYGIVKQNQGYIFVNSATGAGTTIDIYLPCVEGLLDPQIEMSLHSEDGSGNETVLVVEDEPGVRRLVVMILKKYGYTVLEAQTGEEALELVQSMGEQVIHLLISDIVLPHMNGFTLAQQLSEQFPHLKALLISGYTNEAILQYGIVDQGAPFLQKPFTSQVLVQRVRSVLDSV